MSPRHGAGEGRLQRQGWRLLGASDRLVGVRLARWAASVVLRARARPAPGAPGLTRLPARWWTTSPRVRVRRLGLRLDLDLRDNLQRTLYATGTYEPALVRFLHDELRPGDVMLDVEGAELAALQGMAGSLARLRPRRRGGRVKQRVLDRAGVDGDEVRELLGRLGDRSTGQVLPVANEVYRPLATSRPPAASTR